MDLSKGCTYCAYTPDKYNQFKCPVTNMDIYYAGACFTAKIGEKMIIVENCPKFKDKNERRN